ncbi:MAG: U32 family peptidase [Lachnospiraceae bacterium]|nr:U32 family peptidase [Lachnospiraceae bacterium]
MMELLAPAGSLEALKTAVLYGADAVYVGGEMYGLRAKAKNFDRQQMKEGVMYAHAHGVRVHVTVNIIAHNQHLEGLEEYLLFLEKIGVDALIMADAGMISVARKVIPQMEIHLSTQASATNYATFGFWYEQGIKRVVAAREVSLKELAEIRQHTPKELEIEAFAHGAMCISISGRCLLSNYLAGRDSNLGACTHPCRWRYHLVEESRPGEYFPVEEGQEGTYIFNSKDLCMIEYLPELAQAGVSSIKIEGRMKTPLYVAMVTKIYREALDDLKKDPALYASKKQYYKEMLGKVSHRGYTTGFYIEAPGAEQQVYDTADYIKKIDFVGKVLALPQEPEGLFLVEQRGKFSEGEELLLLPPKGPEICFRIDQILDEAGVRQASAPHAQQKLWVKLPQEAAVGSILAKKKQM